MEKSVNDALEKGITHGDTKGSFNRYLTSLYFFNKTANNIRVYDYFVYIFADQTLITVLPLPYKYKRDYINSLKKRKENNNEKSSTESNASGI